MKIATLVRGPSSDDGTFGKLATDDGSVSVVTGELPYRDNQENISCINPGSYICKNQWSNKHGRNLYHLQDVDGHTNVEIHAANWMGDTALGKKCQLLGCIAPGERVTNMPWRDDEGIPHDQTGISSSVEALNHLEAWANGEDFTLVIQS